MINQDEPGDAHTTAYYLLEGLVEMGVDYIFANLGTDHVALIEEMARWRRLGRKYPNMVLCPHENVAIHMAAGYAAMTGRGQVVLVHVDSGTANAAMGLHNLFRSRLPVMLMAGRAPYTLRGELPGSRDNYVHFVQDPFDIGSLVRPYVKWEYSLPSGLIVKEVLQRGHAQMQSDPPGPVYLTLPREVLAEPWSENQVRPFPDELYGAVSAGGVDPARLIPLVERLLSARSPMVVTSYLGRKVEAVSALSELSALCGIRVYEFQPTYMSISRESACFGGFDPSIGLASCDLGLMLDVDVPWLPRFTSANSNTWWAHIDVDPLKQDFPMWGFASNLRLQADSATVMYQVIEMVRERADSSFHARVAERVAGWSQANEARHCSRAQEAVKDSRDGAISAAAVCASLGRVLRPDDIIVNEAIRNSPAVLNQIPRNLPLTLLSSAGGGLGYSGGMALGARLARPGSRVVQVVGDGGFHFCTPDSVYAVAQMHGIPILTVVLDNGGWQAVKEAVLRVYPHGEAASGDEFHARLQGKHRRFEQVCQAFGGYGEAVSDPAELESAIGRCLEAVDAGRAAVLNVSVGLQ